MFTLMLLLGSPVGPYAMAWAVILLVMSATMRFRWAVIYAVVSVLLVFAALFGLLSYYDGVPDKKNGGFVIEGPEFFGIAIVLVGTGLFASLTLALGGIVALVRRYILADRREVELF